MKTTTIAALTALLSTGALAVPMVGHGHDHKAPAHGHMHLRNKRDIIWVTEFAVETVLVVKTVYDDGESPPSEPTDAATTTILADAPAATSAAAPAPASPSEAGSSPEAAYTPPAPSTEAPAPAPTTSAYVEPAPPAATTPAPAPTVEAAPAPSPETTTYVAPAPAPVPAPETTTTAPAPAPAPSQSSGGGGGGGASFTGEATHWEPAMGACGWTNTADEMVVAISMIQFDPETPNGNPNNNSLCGKFINIKCVDGSTVSAKVVDRCVGCAIGDLDMTKTLFDKVTNIGDGRVGGIEWSWA